MIPKWGGRLNSSRLLHLVPLLGNVAKGLLRVPAMLKGMLVGGESGVVPSGLYGAPFAETNFRWGSPVSSFASS
jgi:hypothetical protein